jgi:SAM-dependent methyltransferase
MNYNSLVRSFQMSTAAGSAYDRILYPSLPVANAHPDRLATLAFLFGLEPAPVHSCRVLELGCGDGSHLIPIALAFPASRCVGIDLARVPIEKGQRLAAELSLSNLVLHQLDVADVDTGFGEFDYIVAHGLYSWVPPATRERLFEVCRSNLAPRGIAFISYNTYPGCHLRDMMREMLLYQTRGISDPDSKLKHACALINFLAASEPKSVALREELAALQSRSAPSLFHDDLAEVNQPVYVREFVEQARRHGLEYVAEAEFKAVQYGGLSRETIQMLRLVAGGDKIREQQYLDFLKCRRFRQTLLCHREAPVLDAPDPGRAVKLRAASPLQPVSDSPDLDSDAEEEFRSLKDESLKTNQPLAKATLFYLSKHWPVAVPFDELLSGPEDRAPLAELLIRLCTSGVVELHTIPSGFITEVTERPRVYCLARIQARESTRITTLRHTTVELQDEQVRQLLLLADGTRSRQGLLSALGASSDDLDRNLRKLARMALLEA